MSKSVNTLGSPLAHSLSAVGCSAKSIELHASLIDWLCMSPIQMTSQTACYARIRRWRILAFPAASKVFSIHSGSIA